MKQYLIRFIVCAVVFIDIAMTSFVVYKITDPFAWWIVMLLGMIEVVIVAVLWDFIKSVDDMVYNRRYVRPAPETDDNDDEYDFEDVGDEDDGCSDETFAAGFDRVTKDATETYPAWLDYQKSIDLQHLLDGYYPDYSIKSQDVRDKIEAEVERIDNDGEIGIFADMFDADIAPIRDKFETEYKDWREDLRKGWFDEYGAVEDETEN